METLGNQGGMVFPTLAVSIPVAHGTNAEHPEFCILEDRLVLGPRDVRPIHTCAEEVVLGVRSLVRLRNGHEDQVG